MALFELAIALGATGALWWQTHKMIRARLAAQQEAPRVHECSMMGHDYQPCYDEQAGEFKASLPQAGPFLKGSEVVAIAEANAKTAASVPKKRVYVHSVCRYCGLTVDRPEKK